MIEAGLTVVLIIFVAADRSRDLPFAANGRWPMVPATNGSYWLAMLTAGTLGTASGDFVADVVGLGLFYNSAMLAALYGAVLVLAWRFGATSKPWYWASIVAARTAGTTMGDLIATRHGLNLGLPFSTAVTASILAAAVILWPHRSDTVPEPAT